MHDEDDDYQATDYSKLSTTEIRDKLIWWWFYFLRQNEIFESYCEAKRDGKTEICAELEGDFERIAELYDDWRDIHILPSMHDEESPEWKSWLAEKRHLFCPDRIELLTPRVTAADSKDFQVSIPRGLSKDQLKDLFEEFLGNHPELLGTGPKYSIRVIRGERPHETLQRLDNANLVYDLLSGAGEFKYTHAEIAALVLKIPTLQPDFKWFPRGGHEVAIKSGISLLSDPDVLKYKRTIINLQKFYAACVDSTIRGEFPARTKVQ